MTSTKFDLFVVLEALDANDRSVYEQLASDPIILAEYEKALGYILPLWMIGSSSNESHAELIKRFDRDCNLVWYQIKDHPILRSKLLACCGLGRRVDHKFFKSSLPKYDNDIYRFLASLYPDIRRSEAETWIRTNEPKVFKKMVEDRGAQQDEVKELVKLYRKMRKALCP